MLSDLTKVTKNKEFNKEIKSDNDFFYYLSKLQNNIYLILHLAENYDARYDVINFDKTGFEVLIHELEINFDLSNYKDKLYPLICKSPKHNCWDGDHNFEYKFQSLIEENIEIIEKMANQYKNIDFKYWHDLTIEFKSILDYEFPFFDVYDDEINQYTKKIHLDDDNDDNYEYYKFEYDGIINLDLGDNFLSRILRLLRMVNNLIDVFYKTK